MDAVSCPRVDCSPHACSNGVSLAGLNASYTSSTQSCTNCTSPNMCAFIQLDACKRSLGKIINVAGVVDDFMNPTNTKSNGTFPTPFKISPPLTPPSEFMCTLRLRDPSCPNGIRARFFSKRQHELPEVSHGDVVFLSKVEVSLFNSEIMLIANRKQYSFVVAHKGGGVSSHPLSRQLTEEEKARVPQLTEGKARVPQLSGRGTGARAHAKLTMGGAVTTTVQFSLVQAMMEGKHYHMVGKVVRKELDNGSTRVNVTDFTMNQYLDKHSRSTNWPMSKYMLEVILLGVNNMRGRTRIERGQYLFLQNMHVRRKGAVWENWINNYEGVLNDLDGSKPGSFAVMKDMGNRRVRDVMKREQEYQRRHKHYFDEEKQPTPSPKLNPKILFSPCSIPVMNISEIIKDLQLNPPWAVYSKETALQSRTFSTICKVIDYTPDTLENFAVFREKDVLDFDGNDDGTRRKWIWSFNLQVEGTDGQTGWIRVGDKDAKLLLVLHASE